MPLKKIMCAVDFSEPSRHALDSAAHLARSLSAELIALHVIKPLSSFDVGMGAAISTISFLILSVAVFIYFRAFPLDQKD